MKIFIFSLDECIQTVKHEHFSTYDKMYQICFLVCFVKGVGAQMKENYKKKRKDHPKREKIWKIKKRGIEGIRKKETELRRGDRGKGKRPAAALRAGGDSDRQEGSAWESHTGTQDRKKHQYSWSCLSLRFACFVHYKFIEINTDF